MQNPARNWVTPEVVFQTRRLVCRRIAPEDALAMLRVYGDSEAMRWVGDGSVLDLAQCHEWISVTLHNYVAKGYGMFALECGQSGSVIGFCGIVHPGGQTAAEIKYALHRAHWGQGLATEAVNALLEVAPRLGLRQVIATTAPENLASHAVLQKAGMQRGDLVVNDDGYKTQLFNWHAEESAQAPAAD